MWKTVKDFPCYEVNEHGEIRIVKTKHIMKPQYDKDGYQCIKLYDSKNKIYKHLRIHRLVLETFLRPPLEEKNAII
uniref:NUMOD4 motif protein n=1 Tax=Siphoviridae sp. ctZHD14 TaxID=2827891 RepID=A0A8S5SVN9_9CAUD|nr:MAG TPA: NUMOD4 motif protein [Siphoviridae sp. ctZHD14]